MTNMTKDNKTMPCPYCNGRGFHKACMEELTCEMCKGTGEVTKDKQKSEKAHGQK